MESYQLDTQYPQGACVSSELTQGMGSFLSGLLFGAGTMYLLDPERGRRRRMLVRGKANRFARRTGRSARVAAQMMRDKGYGMAAEARSALRSDHADDEVIEARVRSRMGHIVSHPHAIDVHVEDGEVVLSGPILAHEERALIRAVERIRGVQEVYNDLEPHERPGRVPGLQGGRQPRRESVSLVTRSICALGGIAALGYGLTHSRRGAGTLATTVGFGLLARAASEKRIMRLAGVGASNCAVDIRKSISLDAPIEEVYNFWTRFENFPRFMAHLREVEELGHGRSRWVASGPAGIPVEWNAVITRMEPNRLIAWKSEAGSTVSNTGQVRFREAAHGGTEVEVSISYNPPAGSAGHLIAALFGRDPKRAMDDDFRRLKSLFETGKARGTGEQVRMEEFGRV